MRRTFRRLRIPVLAVGLAVVWSVTGCSASDPTSDDGAGHGSAHDSHGSGADGASEDDALTPPEGADWNEADAEFMTMMPVHHAQAIEMSALAAKHAQSRQVKALARSIDIAQGLEIVVYSGWLSDRDLPTPEAGDEHAGHDMSGMSDDMPGMLSDDEMTALSQARGAAFDRLFLRSMIAHHQGAVEMAEEVQLDGIDVRVQELADDVIGSQQGEIGRMRDLLRA